MTNAPFHIQAIREALSKKQRANPSYSLRAFGRDLNLNSSTLSQVLNGKRPLPIKDCERVAKTLKLTPVDRMRFFESALKKHNLLNQIQTPSYDDRYLIDESHYRVIAEWEHYAVLTLVDLTDFKVTLSSVIEKLGITKIRAETVLQNLQQAQLLKRDDDGFYQKIHSSVRTTEDVTSQALQNSHLEALELGAKKLESTPLDLRDFSAINVAIDPDQMIEFKTIIREFRQKVSALAKSGKQKRDVYQLALQFYPLTQNKGELK